MTLIMAELKIEKFEKNRLKRFKEHQKFELGLMASSQMIMSTPTVDIY
jgi:hypothetical protein